MFFVIGKSIETLENTCLATCGEKYQMNQKPLFLTEYENNLLLSIVDRKIREIYNSLERDQHHLYPHEIMRRESDLKEAEVLMSKLEKLNGFGTGSV